MFRHMKVIWIKFDLLRGSDLFYRRVDGVSKNCAFGCDDIARKWFAI